jgi:predicted esterase
VQYQEFDMGHSIVPEVLNVVRYFVRNPNPPRPVGHPSSEGN